MLKTVILVVAGGGVLALAARRTAAELKARKVGWRVGHSGRHCMYYEELVGGRWERIDLDGEMLAGRSHHIIYFASENEWSKKPAWARERRAEIITRIKTVFGPPGYEYHGA